MVDVANFNELFEKRFEYCKALIQNLNNKQASRKVVNLLVYEPIYYHIVPHRANDLDRVRLLVLRIEGRTPLHRAFSLEEFSIKLDENAVLARDPD